MAFRSERPSAAPPELQVVARTGMETDFIPAGEVPSINGMGETIFQTTMLVLLHRSRRAKRRDSSET